MIAPMQECPECKTLFAPERPSREGGCCSRKCARTRQARQGVPSTEDKRASLLDAVGRKFDELFKAK